jgi:hypothetical protein
MLPVGGDTGGRRWAAVDRDGDGTDEIAIIRGGRIVLRQPNGTLLWATAPLGVDQIIAVADLDGDGEQEIWARSRLLLVSLKARTGTVAWRSDLAAGSYLGAVKPMTTASGERRLYVADAGCSMNGAGGARLLRPTADGGFEEEASFDTRAHGYWCGIADAFGDLDGDDEPEIVTLSDNEVIVYDRTGAPRWRVEVGRIPFGVGQVAVVDVDGDGRDEVVIATNNVAVGGLSARRVMLVELEQGALAVRWSLTAGADDAVRLGPPLVADVVGDAHPEIIASIQSGGVWTTYVWPGTAKTASDILATRSGVLLGLDGEGLVLSDTSLAVPGFGVVRREVVSGPSIGATWTVPDALAAVRAGDWTGPDALVTHEGSVLLLRDLDGDRRADTASLSSGAVIMPASVEQTPLAAMPLAGGRVALSRSDGRIAVYAAGQPINLVGEIPLPGLQETNTLTRALVTTAISSLRLIATADGAGTVLGYAPLDNGSAHDPALRWKLPGVLAGQTYARWLPSPIVFAGSSMIAPYRQRDGALTIDSYNPVSGVRTNSMVASLESTSAPQFDAVPYGSGLLFSWRDTISNFATHIATGAPSVSAFDAVVGGNSESPVSISDVTGDSVDDSMLLQNGRLRVIDGASGTMIRNVAVGGALGILTPADLDGDQVIDYLIHGAFATTRLSLDGAVVWTHQPDVAHLPAAIVRTTAGVRIAVPEFDAARLVLLDGASGAELDSVVLAGGEAHPTVDTATAAGKQPGQISAALGVDDLSGHGEPGVIVGSSDGFLYALKLDPLELAWALDFRATVGEPVAADTDGDGIHEILAPVGDGHIAVVTNAALPSPTAVFESDCTDVPAADDDLDEISTQGPLGISWLPVENASGYRVLVLRSDGVVVVQWKAVGNVTSTLFQGIVFEEGQRYEVRVTAYAHGSMAPLVSGESISDGFVAIPHRSCPSGQVVDGCCSSTRHSGPRANGALLMAAICALILGRRRRALANHGRSSGRTGSPRSSSL